MRKLSRVLVTGWAGFIGSNFIRYLLARPDFDGRVINVDKLTYAGNRDNLAEVEEIHGGTRHLFVEADVCDAAAMRFVMERHEVDTIVHFAAESHVDRSIHGARAFIQTNVMGTFTLLETARARWEGREDVLFHQVSTDEVFGSLGPTGRFTESSPMDPHSPYAASKAAADLLARAAHATWGLPLTISNCSNNYGPRQFPEKLVPLTILNCLEGQPIPVYGNGSNVRDWLFVDDHSEALWSIMRAGKTGRTYAVGGGEEKDNLSLVRRICAGVGEVTGKGGLDQLITFVTDRPGHDWRYAIDASRIHDELGWSPRTTLEEGLEATIRWYCSNPGWVVRVRNGDYREWVDRQYGALARPKRL
jgi:dTDP-glucose 4,6-dehydratase